MHILSSWQKAPDHLHLRDEELHVWRISLNQVDPVSISEAHTLLDDEEQLRADRLVIESARTRFILAHAATRNILARYLVPSGAKIKFDTGQHGKPHIRDSELKFNLSHSGNMALLAITNKIEVGSDIEHINERHAADDIAARFFSPAEQQAYQSFPESERTPAFFRCWSRKEAVIKALGEGLSCPLSSFDVTLDKHQARLIDLRRDHARVEQWTMFDIEAHPDYAAAAAAIGPCRSATGYNYIAAIS